MFLGHAASVSQRGRVGQGGRGWGLSGSVRDSEVCFALGLNAVVPDTRTFRTKKPLGLEMAQYGLCP